MSSNYLTRAILALPGLPERELRFLLALETVTPGEGGWREAGTELLAGYGRMSAGTAVRARRGLIASGLIEYERGGGSRIGAYRMRVNVHPAALGKGGHNADPGGWSNRPPEGGQGVVTTLTPGGGHLDAVTSGDAAGAFKTFSAPISSALPGAGPAAIIRAAYPDATDDEIRIITEEKTRLGARNLAAVLAHEIEQGTLRLPCDPAGPEPHSQACREGYPGQCRMSWCTCRCHVEPAKPAPEEGTG